MKRKKTIFTVSLIAIILAIPIAISFNQPLTGQNFPALPSGSSTSGLSNGGQGAFGKIRTYSTGLSGAPVILDGNTLMQMTGGSDSVAAFDLVIQEYFLPMAVNYIFLDIGWENDANTSTTLVAGGYAQWVANWLQASEQFGITNIFFMKQFGYYFAAPSWDQDFMNAYPSAQTDNASGNFVPFKPGCAGCQGDSGWTFSSPYVYRQYEQDLTQLYRWYGNYTSWVGFGEGATGDVNEYAGEQGSTINTAYAFDNYTMSVFANSVFFQRTVNASGYYLGTNTLSKIWSMFVNREQQNVVASSGVPLIYPEQYPIYGGTGSGGNLILQRFYIPFGETLNGFTLGAYLQSVGSPTSGLSETIYPDNTSIPTSGQPVLSNPLQTVSVSSVGPTAGWVTTTFSATLVGGNYYWVAFWAPSSGTSSLNYYNVNVDQESVFTDIYLYTSNNGLTSITRQNCCYMGSVLWIKNLAGKSITVYPYYNQGPNWSSLPGSPVSFEVNSKMQVNTISFFESDRGYDPNNITVSIEYLNGTVLTTGSLDIFTDKGIGTISYLPIQLANVVTLYPNIQYRIYFSALPANDEYSGYQNGALGGGKTQDFLTLTANPASAGYLGQSTWPLFELGLMNTEPSGISNFDYLSQTDLQYSPGYTPSLETGMRFLASANENLQQFEMGVISANSGSGSVTVTLRPDNETEGSHPATTVLASGSISMASIAASLKPAPITASSEFAWANITSFSGNTALTAGTYYWLVISAPYNENFHLSRLVNPYKNLVYDSSSNFANDWGTPSDGPTDLAYQIATSGQDYNNTVIGTSNAFSSGSQVAQSFSSTNSFQLKGLWLDTSAGASDFKVTIQSDSGSDSPSGQVLSYGTVQFNTPGESMNYVSLTNALNVTAGTKYWIVVTPYCTIPGSCGSYELDVNTYRSDYSGLYGNGVLHYEVYSGSGWIIPYINGEIDFILEGSNLTIHTYNTKTLFNELTNFEDTSSSLSPYGPWVSFLQYQEAVTLYNLTQFMQGYSGRQFLWFSSPDMSNQLLSQVPNFTANYVLRADSGAGGDFYPCPVTDSSCGGNPTFWLDDASDHFSNMMSSSYPPNWLPWSSYGSTPDNRGGLTPIDTRTELLMGIPFTATEPLTFNDWAWGAPYHGINNVTQTKYDHAFATIIERMQYNGPYFGSSKDALSVLWIGSSGDGFFPQYFTSVAKITFVSSSYSDINNLTIYGNFGQFNVIIGSPPSATASFNQRLQAFVQKGGGYIETSFGDAPNSQDNLLGLTTSSTAASVTSSLMIETQNKITSPYSSISYAAYWLRNQIGTLSNESAQILVKDSNGNPYVTTNNYGSGIAVLLESPYDNFGQVGNAQSFNGFQYGSPRDSYISLMINAMFYAGHKGNMLPILWENSYNQQQNWSPYLQYSIDGSPGRPVLLWLSNNASTPSSFSLNLNASFYGISSSGWEAINMLNMQVLARGTGSDISLSTSVPAYDWYPIYIINATSPDLVPYSTASVVSESSGSFVFTPYLNQSTWAIIQSSSMPSSVSSNLTGTLPEYSTISSLNQTAIGYECTSVSLSVCTQFSSQAQEGWYYDSTNGLLYVHFRGDGPVKITLSGISTTTSISSSTSTTAPTSSSTTTSSASFSTSTSTTSSSSSTTSSSTSSASTSSTSSTTASSTPLSQSQSTSTSSVAQTTSTSTSASSTVSGGSTTSSKTSQSGSSTARNSNSLLSFVMSSPESAGLTTYVMVLIAGLPLVIRVSRSAAERRDLSNYRWRW